MLRKNDVQRILAERNILIAVRNPFVVILISTLDYSWLGNMFEMAFRLMALLMFVLHMPSINLASSTIYIDQLIC